MKLLFIDVETTGLDPDIHEVIDIALIQTDLEGIIEKTWHSKIRPGRPCSAEAAKVNGYSPEAWASAPSYGEVVTVLREQGFKDRYILAGWNVDFDKSFAYRLLEAAGIHWNYKSLDIFGMAWSIYYEFMVDYIEHNDRVPKLEHVLEYARITNNRPHTAMGDCQATAELYWKIY